MLKISLILVDGKNYDSEDYMDYKNYEDYLIGARSANMQTEVPFIVFIENRQQLLFTLVCTTNNKLEIKFPKKSIKLWKH